jgi:hypothetical protein
MDKNIGNIAIILLDISNQLKIYHWRTKSYARHKSSDELIKNITESTDKIIETFQGSRNVRLQIPSSNNNIILQNQDDYSIIELLKEFKNYLSNIFPRYLTSKDTDILNLRDELLGHVDQALYLFTFS